MRLGARLCRNLFSRLHLYYIVPITSKSTLPSEKEQQPAPWRPQFNIFVGTVASLHSKVFDPVLS